VKKFFVSSFSSFHKTFIFIVDSISEKEVMLYPNSLSRRQKTRGCVRVKFHLKRLHTCNLRIKIKIVLTCCENFVNLLSSISLNSFSSPFTTSIQLFIYCYFRYQKHLLCAMTCNVLTSNL
jgi:hypothetical protein